MRLYIPQDGKFLENLVSPCETTNPLFTRQEDGNVSRRWKSDFWNSVNGLAINSANVPDIFIDTANVYRIARIRITH